MYFFATPAILYGTTLSSLTVTFLVCYLSFNCVTFTELHGLNNNLDKQQQSQTSLKMCLYSPQFLSFYYYS